jgi:putative ABC transport system permease protein
MLKSFFTIGIRNLLKQKGYSFIKIAGLALGLAASMLIFLYVSEDLSYDKFNSNYNHIARALTIDKGEGVSSKLVGVTPPAMGPAVNQELPEVIDEVRILNQGRYDLGYGDKTLKCDGAFYTESSFFHVFDFPIIAGDKNGILDKPNSIVITESLAKKIFGDEDPMGKTIKLNQTIDLFVNGLMKDPPKNSHLQFDLLRSMVAPEGNPGFRQFLESWQGLACHTYLLLNTEVNVEDLNSKIQAISKKHNAVEFFVPVVQPLRDVHLRSKEVLFESNANKSDILNVYVLSTIAILILILAAVNFTNMVTAKSTGRAKEVGMRKAIGAMRNQLVFQHLIESVTVTFVSSCIALAMVYTLTGPLNSMYQRSANFFLLLSPQNLLLLLSLILGVGIMAGIYPAFVLSSFKPALVLKGAFKSSNSGVRLRKVLVVTQFTISIALMAGTGIVYQQMQFIFNKDLGYSRDQLITIQQNGPAVAKTDNLKNELKRNTSILEVGTSSNRLGQQLGRTQIFPEGVSNETNIITSVMNADDHFIPAMGMTMAAGRNFSLDFKDSLSMIVNEELVRLLKWSDAVGKKISIQSGATAQDQTAYTIVGVVKDFHFATVRHKLEPLFILYNKNNGSVAIKINSTDAASTIAFIKETWLKVNPGTTFEYNFLDDQFANLYKNEQAFSSMFTHFTLLAIIIAGLGLFALSAFTAEQRRKEIGIRKVMGASNQSIFYILSKEFIELVLIAFAFASVVAYFVMDKWLQDFSYSITIRFPIFLWAGVASVGIALLTISFQALKAAWANPADSLRIE